jgi:hypothetical protein
MKLQKKDAVCTVKSEVHPVTGHKGPEMEQGIDLIFLYTWH